MTNPLFLLDPAHDDVPVNSDELNTGWKLTLPSSVRRHAIQAMRLADGDELDLSDGEGLRIHAVIADAAAGLAEVREVGREPQPVARLALIQALAKTGHDEQAIDMATQIGVDQVIPWQADRSIAKWKAGRTDRKWSQVLAAATEQSRRAWMPELSECVTSKQMLAICRRACVHGDLVVVLHQDATDTWDGIETLARQLADRCLDDGRTRTINVMVGPEGGISEDEVSAFRDAGAHVCVLGGNILRAATAGPVALTLLARTLGRM
ncbi:MULTISPECIES: 16S rRNA (uracil(1498)-N(3))-methyltransferase [Bifidobacterium]|uniref:16S rRNA (uracil(1498)-N(3))-methyltransferase n=1 Tax=Bifidobacterium TaxID=1678 RepID=UPI001BDD3B63|nr:MULTISPECIES: 16S rRNA (uracil(1498)-N(3))-methyltransferase [Bifidobacterium]MBT1161342.1 16S rRNA (uracil(1498)-N(3))-methyltransferase [Bifidobacterium sp. SO1]MBW3078388.1 16S rRNA (uracil(1498)-N(3))-methyltransferase [Bifidobacterium simiiventris]